MLLEGKNALITGAARGIGAAMVEPYGASSFGSSNMTRTAICGSSAGANPTKDRIFQSLSFAPSFSDVPVLPPIRNPGSWAFRPDPSDTTLSQSAATVALVSLEITWRFTTGVVSDTTFFSSSTTCFTT